MMNSLRTAALIILVLSIPYALFSQESEELPNWVRLEQGKRLFEEGEFGEALVIFEKLRGSTDSYPEADFWIGRVFEEEGELDLAESQYLKAIASQKDLYMYQDVLHIQNRLAQIYRISRQYHKYEEILKESIRFGGGESIVDGPRMFPLMVRTLKDKGLDKLFELYRLDESMVLHAHSELGLFYYRTGRYEESIRNLIVSMLTILTRIANEMRYYDPLYEVESVDELLSRALRYESVESYLSSVSFFPVLYYLGASLYAAGDIRESRALFTLVTDYSISGKWSNAAMRQLTEPFIEPILTAEDYFYF